MQNVSQEEIGRVVEEVLRRVTSLVPSGVGGAAAPQAKAECACTKGECECPECKTQRTKANKQILEKGACRIGCSNPRHVNCEELAGYIDHTLLKPNATDAEIEKLCNEARQYRFASVCVNSSYVELCRRLLEGSGVKVCAVVGFPLGAMSRDSKAFETRDAMVHGAEEVDMVINVGKLQSGDFAYTLEDIRSVVRAAAGKTVKVIIEAALLNEDQKIAACVLAKAAGADFVKTSTGFASGGATAEDVALMRRIVGEQMGVKAAGGIRDCAVAQQMVESGATRIGASASISIVKGQNSNSSY